MIKFRTFRPIWEWQERGRGPYSCSCNVCISPEVQINDWLAENPNVEIISWQATAVEDHNELYITIQYKEN